MSLRADRHRRTRREARRRLRAQAATASRERTSPEASGSDGSAPPTAEAHEAIGPRRRSPPAETPRASPAWIDGPWLAALPGRDGGPSIGVAFPVPGRRSTPGSYRAALRLDPCSYCGRPVLQDRSFVSVVARHQPEDAGTVEHLTRRIDERGLHENIVGACRRCNKGRGDLTVLEMLLRERDIAA